MSITIISGGGARFRKISSEYMLFNPHWVGVTSLGIPRYGACGFIYNNILFIVGGVTIAGVSSAVEIIDLSTFERSYVESMPEARAFFGFGVIGGKLYVLGGVDRSYTPTNTIFVYDIVNNSWSTLTVTLPKKIAYCGYSTLGSEIYVIGGIDEEGNILKDVYSFNTANNTVSTKASLNIARQNHACAVLQDKIYCFGGDNGTYNLRSIEVYDPSTDTWTVSSVEMPEALTGITASTITIGDRSYIIVIGG